MKKGGRLSASPAPLSLAPHPSPGKTLLSPRRLTNSPGNTSRFDSSFEDPTVVTETQPIYVRGHILRLSGVTYIIMFIILLSAETTEWVPRIRFYNLVPYAAICSSVIQAMRFFRASFPESPVPLFLNLFPGGFLIVTSREAHVVIAIVFLIFVMGTHAQTGAKRLRYYLPAFVCAYVVMYAFCIVFIDFFFVDPMGDDPWKGHILTNELNIGEEVTFSLSMLMIGVGSYFLMRFVDDYAVGLAIRDSKVSRLVVENVNLVEKMTRHDKGRAGAETVAAEAGGAAPIEKVISILTTMRNDDKCYAPENLDYVLQVLNSNQLYDPSFDLDRVTNLHDRASAGQQLPPSSDNHPMIPMLGAGGRATSDGNILKSAHVGRLDAAEILKSNEVGVEQHLNQLLETVDEWSFDVFAMAHLTGGKALYCVGMAIFDRYQILEKFNIPKTDFENWLRAIEAGYRPQNLYHNSIHAANMLQAMAHFLIHCNLGKWLTDLEVFAALVAATIIDYGHPGLNNDYQIQSETLLAWKYNDISPLENQHLASAFDQMRKKNQNILVGLDPQERSVFREIVIRLVLASDETTYYEAISKFRLRMNRKDKPFPFDEKDRIDLAAIVLRCCLVSNLARPSNLMNQWMERQTEEWFRQGDLERRAGRQCSPSMDRANPDVHKAQRAAIESAVVLFEAASLHLNIDHILVEFENNASQFDIQDRRAGKVFDLLNQSSPNTRRNSAPATKLASALNPSVRRADPR